MYDAIPEAYAGRKRLFKRIQIIGMKKFIFSGNFVPR
jgi:hypothetical protein